MNYSSEVLIYLQKIKIFFKNDIKSSEYFLVDTDEELFFKKVADVAQDNYEKKGDATLNIEQFEEIKNLLRYELLNKTYNTPENKKNIDLFIEHKGFEKICLN